MDPEPEKRAPGINGMTGNHARWRQGLNVIINESMTGEKGGKQEEWGHSFNEGEC
jgi:hypothetical protein